MGSSGNTISPPVGLPFKVGAESFFVTAAAPITALGRVIEPGTHVLIATDIEPATGRMVLVGERLEPWCGQACIRGVATMMYEELPDYLRGLRVSA